MTSDADFLDWIADRLVNVHGENPLYDYIHRLRGMAATARARDGATLDAASSLTQYEVRYGSNPPGAVYAYVDSADAGAAWIAENPEVGPLCVVERTMGHRVVVTELAVGSPIILKDGSLGTVVEPGVVGDHVHASFLDGIASAVRLSYIQTAMLETTAVDSLADEP